MTSPGGGLSITVNTDTTGTKTATLNLADPHGDITGAIPNKTNVTASELTRYTAYTPTGQPQNPTNEPHPYGWIGTAQRNNSNPGGLISMGARTYNPTTGRFLQLDPTPGGNPNPCTYPTDPINQNDPTGQFSIGGWNVTNTISNVTHYITKPSVAIFKASISITRFSIAASAHAWKGIKTKVKQAANKTGGRIQPAIAKNPKNFFDLLDPDLLIVNPSIIKTQSYDASVCAGPCFAITYQDGRFASQVGGVGFGVFAGPSGHTSDSPPSSKDITCGVYGGYGLVGGGLSGTQDQNGNTTDLAYSLGVGYGIKITGSCHSMNFASLTELRGLLMVAEIISVSPPGTGRWIWRWVTIRRVYRNCRLTLYRQPATNNSESSGELRLRFHNEKAHIHPGFDLPIGGFGVNRLLLITRSINHRGGIARETRIVAVDQAGKPLHAPSIVAGYSSQYARPANRDGFWWPFDQLQQLATAAGIEIEWIHLNHQEPDETLTQTIFTDRIWTDPVPLLLASTTLIPIIILILIGVPMSLLSSRWGNLGPGSIILLGQFITTYAAVTWIQLITGWVETQPPHQRKQEPRPKPKLW